MTTALNYYIFSIPIRLRSKEVNSTYTTHIDFFHIIIIPVVYTINQIVSKSRRNFLKLFCRHFRIQAMNFHFQTDASLFSIINMTLGLLDSLYSSSWRTQYHRVFSWSFWTGKIAINIRTGAEALQFHQITVSLFCRIFRSWFYGIFQRTPCCIFQIFLPELIKIVRKLCIWLQLLRRKTNLNMVFIRFSIYYSNQTTVTESWIFHRSDINDSTSVFQLHGASFICWHHIAPEFIFHFHPILRNTIFIKLNFYLSLFSHFIQPVSMIGYCYP